MENLGVFSNGKQIATLTPGSVDAVVKYIINNDLSDEDIENLKIVPLKDSVSISESVATDTDTEWTIWSSSDFSDTADQIPLVKIITNAEGELEAVPLSDEPFDMESYKTAANSLKTTAGRPTKDRLSRIDKSLNHNDPFLSTELQRLNIRANRGQSKQSIRDLLKTDPKTISDEPVTDEQEKAKRSAQIRKDLSKASPQGLQILANQTLISNRDDLKALANNKKTTEEDLVKYFEDVTGVDYYTEKVIDEYQYAHLLDLMGRSFDKYDKTHVAPEENDYIIRLKDLTEDLIEKVLLRNDADFYSNKKTEDEQPDYSDIMAKLTDLANSEFATEDRLADLFEDLTGVNYYTEKITNDDTYDDNFTGSPKDNRGLQNLKDKTEDLIEKVLLREDPDFYK